MKQTFKPARGRRVGKNSNPKGKKKKSGGGGGRSKSAESAPEKDACGMGFLVSLKGMGARVDKYRELDAESGFRRLDTGQIPK